MTTKFTEGDWVIDENARFSINCGHKHIAMVNYYNAGKDSPHTVDLEESLANAKLIAYSPKLYRTLLSLITRLEYNFDMVFLKKAIEEAKHIISKVEN